MKTRRSHRLSKSPPAQEGLNNDSDVDGKKQKLDIQSDISKQSHSKNTTETVNIATNGVTKCKTNCDNRIDSDGSDSSDDYMKTPIDLDSDFFKVDFKKGKASSDFSVIENKIFSDIKHITDSEGSSDFEDVDMLKKYIPVKFPKFECLEGTQTSRKDINNKFRKKSSKKSEPSNQEKDNNNAVKLQKDNSKDSQIKAEEKNIGINDLNSMDVSQILALGESQTNHEVEMKCKVESEEETSDWEEVKEEHNRDVNIKEHSFPKEGVQITVQAPDLYHKRREKGFDMEAYLKRRMNRIKRELQVLIHKVHLLCWISHGLFVNSVLNSEVLMAHSLSLIPTQHSYPKVVHSKYLKDLTSWFIKTVHVKEVVTAKQTFVPLHESLLKQFECATADSKRDLVLMFICLVRSLGLNARLVISLQPLPLKPPASELSTVSTKKTPQGEEKSKGQSRKNEEMCKIKDLQKKGSKVKFRVLSAEEAEQERNRKVMSKKEAAKRIKESSDSEKICSSKLKNSKVNDNSVLAQKQTVVEKKEAAKRIKESSDSEKICSSKLKNSKVNDNSVLPQKQNVVEKTTRHLRARKQLNHKYKDVTDSSYDDDSEHELTSAKRGEKDCEDAEYAADKESIMKNKIISQNTVIRHSKKDDPVKENGDVKSLKKGKLTKELTTNKSSTTKNLENIKEEVPMKHTNLPNKRDLSGTRKATSTRTQGERFSNTEQNSSTQNVNKKKSQKDHPKESISKSSTDEFIVSPGPSTSSPPKVLLKEVTKPSPKPTDSDSDFDMKLTKRMTQAKKYQSTPKIDRRVLSSDSEDDEKLNNNFWAEVLLDDKSWVSVNVVSGKVDCTRELYAQASKPVTYIVAWNTDNTLKDVTRRYCKNFHSDTRKNRVDENWWKESLFPFCTANTALDKKEDEDMERQIQDLPLPTSVGEYKNHPLYALKRHLLKFQAIYPPNAPTLGFVRNEPVYARECVHTLRSREIWLKEAKVVRLGEQPYKIVKARPKYDRMSGKVLSDLPLEIFGSWQTEDYVPPTAVDGKVPRNAYGNVELFKPSMLPKGTVHLQVPGLNRVARKLQIDCAPAVVGFDFHCGASHPTYDGFVVCEEFQDVLLDAWNREQEEAERREHEKRDKRVYGNWRRLIRGLMIRERLNLKYAFGEEETEKEKEVKPKKRKITSKKSNQSNDNDDNLDKNT